MVNINDMLIAMYFNIVYAKKCLRKSHTTNMMQLFRLFSKLVNMT